MTARLADDACEGAAGEFAHGDQALRAQVVAMPRLADDACEGAAGEFAHGDQALRAQVVAMPRLSDSMEEGTIVTWLVADGAPVARGEEIVEVETDKATMPYEAEGDGVLHHAVAAGETVAVGTTIARIAPEGVALAVAPAPASPTAAPTSSPTDRSTTAAGPVPPSVPAAALPSSRVSASPLARRIARELGIDLAALVGSGPNGRVVKRDVLGAEAHEAAEAVSTPPLVSQSVPTKGAATVVPLSRTQQLVGRRMGESKASAPDFTLDVEVDMDAAVAMRARLKQLLGDAPAPSLGDFVIKACALALREQPRVNGAFAGERVELYERVNVGVAVAAPDALLVPTVFDADSRSLGQVGADVRRLAAAARAGTLTPGEMSGATFTVSNLGGFGVDAFTAVLNPPQAAILAVGAVRPRPHARDGELVLAQTLLARLTCDHRILNGADGAAFLARVRALLQAPELLAL
ncbi:dihydrolipoamide acetyltransferase family protein [Conexibacter sp. CPCC 206217]|uniref:dihydrolipoamide acetyltransferase family protein n=1 Tax=Conexibacter sp. CPCC 206217 TaxID=3064574 RepID=UPI0027203D29|nr:dihydrolipoamide acetyltransferase family protein [Conexibacter sp. CPCC 206217]MDO8211891.1 dihydrolipoamide acetyltransferase family protein [Conexibacter sp. CPCC 206217]